MRNCICNQGRKECVCEPGSSKFSLVLTVLLILIFCVGYFL
jgi:hypothetical protein